MNKHTLHYTVLAAFLFAVGCATTDTSENQKTAKPEEPKEPAFVKEGLVAYYPFNGNAKDGSGNGNDGEVKGTALATDRHGEDGETYSFDGQNSYIHVPNSDSLGMPKELSLSVWVKVGLFPGRIMIKGNGHQDNYDFSLGITADGRIGYGWRTVPSAHVDTKTINDINKHEWCHVAVVHNSGSPPVLYINGVTQSVIPNGNQSSIRALWKQPLTIGVEPRPPGFKGYLYGSIDDIRIYNRSLPEQQVKALYDLEKPKK